MGALEEGWVGVGVGGNERGRGGGVNVECACEHDDVLLHLKGAGTQWGCLCNFRGFRYVSDLVTMLRADFRQIIALSLSMVLF